MKPVAIEFEFDSEDIKKLDAVIGISCQGVRCSACPMVVKRHFGGDICVKEILQIVKEGRTNGN